MNKIIAMVKRLAFLLRHDTEYQVNEYGWREVADIIINHSYTEKLLNNSSIVKFLGWGGPRAFYARFEIFPDHMPKGVGLNHIIVTHEGDWINSQAVAYYEEYSTYEAVQDSLGEGLVFVEKGHSQVLNRSIFVYRINQNMHNVLAVPATGEEIYFTIYGVDNTNKIHKLVGREL